MTKTDIIMEKIATIEKLGLNKTNRKIFNKRLANKVTATNSNFMTQLKAIAKKHGLPYLNGGLSPITLRQSMSLWNDGHNTAKTIGRVPFTGTGLPALAAHLAKRK